MERYLAVHRLPENTTRELLLERLERVAHAAQELGVRPIETLFSAAGGHAVSLVDAGSPRDVVECYTRAGLPAPDVMPGERVHTELLEPPRRAD